MGNMWHPSRMAETETPRPRLTPPRAWAYTGMLLGGTVSLAANVAHSLLRPDPPLGAILFSVLWPVLLFVTTEIILRNTFRGLRSALAWAGLAPVAVIAAVASYQHLSGLLAHYGETRFVSLGGPLAVDALMVLSTGLLFANKDHTPQPVPASVPVLATVHTLPRTEPPTQDPVVRPIDALSTTRQQQIDAIRAAVPNMEDREDLTWDQIGRIAGVTGRATIGRIRAALTAADRDLEEAM